MSYGHISSSVKYFSIFGEIFYFRHAYNITIKELTGLVVKVMLEQPFSENPSLAGAEAMKVLTEVGRKENITVKDLC